MQLRKLMSIICAAAMFFNSLLHILLICGAPLGEFVLGGAYVVFPLRMRLLSAGFALLWGFFGVLYLQLGGVIKKFLPRVIMLVLLVAVTLFLYYGVVGNLFFTQSPKERLLMAPLTIIASICSSIALISALRRGKEQ